MTEQFKKWCDKEMLITTTTFHHLRAFVKEVERRAESNDWKSRPNKLRQAWGEVVRDFGLEGDKP